MRGSEIKALRERLGLSQAQFAERFALNLETIKGWEQKRFKPDQAACVLLSTIARSPEAVDQAVAPTRGVELGD
jgi:putative transcriptional regulator